MSILIDKVRIKGFRGIQRLELTLPRITILIGPNNSGKTSIIKAIQLVIGDYIRYLSEEDFYISQDGHKATEIIVDLRIIPINEQGARSSVFSEVWASAFGFMIQAETDGTQYVALRARVSSSVTKSGYECLRYYLKKWTEIALFDSPIVQETKINTRQQNIHFVGIEAQRDLYKELHEKTSFVGKILSSIQYNTKDIEALEDLIKEVNESTISKSPELEGLRSQLGKLNDSFGSSGTTEITPFPKKLRDLSKNFNVNFGHDAQNNFSIEYHGMGTRSWASILTVRSFIELMIERYARESEPFLPLVAAEEPEAHLHPNAQKTLYQQLTDIKGQIIVSTHSPYLITMADPLFLRSLKITINGCQCMQLTTRDVEDMRQIKRQVIHSHGDILFAKAIILCEGETEAQALPMLLEKKFNKTANELNVAIIGVGGSGAHYKPFLTLVNDFNIPVYIFSDGEYKARRDLLKTWNEVFKEDIKLDNHPSITILGDTDFEGYLLKEGFDKLVEDAILSVEGEQFIDNWIRKKDGTQRKPISDPTNICSQCKQSLPIKILRNYKANEGRSQAIQDILDAGKTKYSPVITKKLCELNNAALPSKIIEFFDKLKIGIGL